MSDPKILQSWHFKFDKWIPANFSQAGGILISQVCFKITVFSSLCKQYEQEVAPWKRKCYAKEISK